MSTNTARNITVIPANVSRIHNAPKAKQNRRVAAYARVSTDSDEQLTSYEAQVDYYTRHIRENPGWKFVSVYADEGISATSTKKRDGFNRMIADALDGKIDLILTKSVSRFARNTVDSLMTVRILKEKGVEVYFEKENIYTLDSKGELLITIMSSLAQEESRSISENVTWGQRKRMADGKVAIPYAQFLGYRKGANDQPVIVESEAKSIRLIYSLFLEGKTYQHIARNLTELGIPTPRGKKQWSVSTVMSILQNEKYKGDAILQKRFTVDFLTKATKKNEGEVPQYYVSNSHPAIIEPELFDMVQEEIQCRKTNSHGNRSYNPFAGKIICGECGGVYGSKVWHSADKYKRTVWQCNQKYGGGKYCETPHLCQKDLEQAFVTAFNRLVAGRESIFDEYQKVLPVISDTSALDKKIEKLAEESAALYRKLEECVRENAVNAQDQDAYEQRYAEFTGQYEAVEKRLNKAKKEKQALLVRKEKIQRFLADLRRQDILDEFDEQVWCSLVDHTTVYADRRLVFTFRDGTEIPVNL